MNKMDKGGRWLGMLLCTLVWLWSGLLRAEVKVIPVFDAGAAVQTLREIYPDLGVSAMGNQLVLSGTPAQLQEAETTLAQLNNRPRACSSNGGSMARPVASSWVSGLAAMRPNGNGCWMATPGNTSRAKTTTGRCAACRGDPYCCRWDPINQ